MANSSIVGVLRAMLTADTASFDAAMADASKSVKAWTTDFTKLGLTAEQVGAVFTNSLERSMKEVNRLAKEFSGAVLAKSADEYAAAVQRIGGASMLTEKEQAKVNAVMQEAIAKYKALGQEAPAHLLKLEQATRKLPQPLDQTNASLDKIWNGLKGAAGLIGITFSAQAVVGFARHVFDTASNIHDMSLKLGVSAEATQRLKFAADQTGASIDDMGRAISFASRNLAEGNDKTFNKAVADAGLELGKLRGAKPDEMFLAMAEAIKGIDDPMRQADLAFKLLGKSGVELLPAIKEGIKDIGDQATVMSDQTVASLERAQDAWEALGNRITIISGNMIGDTASAVSEITSSWKSFTAFLLQSGLLSGSAANVHQALGTAALVNQMRSELTFNDKEIITDLLITGTSVEDMATVLNKAVPVVRAYVRELQNFKPAGHGAAGASDEAAKATKRHAEAVAEWVSRWSGAKLADEVKLAAEGFAKLTDAQREQLRHSPEFIKWLSDVVSKGGDLPPVLHRIFVENAALPQSVFDTSAALKSLGQMAGVSGKDLQNLAADLTHVADRVNEFNSKVKIGGTASFAGGISGDDLRKFFPAPDKDDPLGSFNNGLALASDLFRDLAQVSGDSMGRVARSIGAAVAQAHALVSGLRQATSANVGQSITGMIPVFGAIADIGTRIFNEIHRETIEARAELAALGLTENRPHGEGAIYAVTHPLPLIRAQIDGYKEIQRLLEQQRAIQEKLATVRERSLSALSKNFDKLIGLGGQLPDFLQGAIGQLVAIGDVSQDTFDQLFGLNQAVDWKTLQQEAEEYGVDIAALGPAFEQAKLVDQALALVKAWNDFNLVGSDGDAILRGLADEANELVRAALKAGLELPESMRPMLQRMADLGLLTDDAGNKIEDLGAIKFSDTLEKQIGSLVDAIKELLRGLGLIPSAADEAARALKDKFYAAHPQVPRKPTMPATVADIPLSSVTSPGLAFVRPGDLIGMPHLGVTADAMAAARSSWTAPYGAGGGGVAGGATSVTIVAWDGASVENWLRNGGDRILAKGLAPRLPDELRPYGVTRL